jgi:23S rRNA (uracil1939-C5)-methyltransferase
MSSVLIESLANGGDGVGHLEDGRAIFVRGACPGDRLQVVVAQDHGRWVSGRIEEILEPSSARVTPPCPYFGACGGCQWQHVAADMQLASKRQIVEDALLRIGHLEIGEDVVRPCAPSPDGLGYRNKIELIASSRSGRLDLGFHRIASDELVPIDRCLLLPKSASDAPKKLAGALRYFSGTQDLGIERVAVRVASHRSDVEIAIWTPPSGFPRSIVGSALLKSLGATSVVRVLADGGREARRPKVEVLAGTGFWRERLAGFPFSVSAPSFFQVNTGAAEKLVDIVLGILEPDGSDRVADVYSGVGTFTLALAEVAGSVSAFEASGSAVRDLRRNLENAQLYAEVEPGDAERSLEAAGAFDLAVVDPPRAGLARGALAALVGTRARRLAYVSCDPATLARDAHALAQAGYDLVSVTPVDLFPQTFHVETVSHFERTATAT